MYIWNSKKKELCNERTHHARRRQSLRDRPASAIKIIIKNTNERWKGAENYTNKSATGKKGAKKCAKCAFVCKFVVSFSTSKIIIKKKGIQQKVERKRPDYHIVQQRYTPNKLEEKKEKNARIWNIKKIVIKGAVYVCGFQASGESFFILFFNPFASRHMEEMSSLLIFDSGHTVSRWHNRHIHTRNIYSLFYTCIHKQTHKHKTRTKQKYKRIGKGMASSWMRVLS